jgi:hypothetical protein
MQERPRRTKCDGAFCFVFPWSMRAIADGNIADGYIADGYIALSG